jgi:hypothetical protein
MTTDAGRKTVAYLTKCALAAGDTLVKHDQLNNAYTFNGSLGLCPQWKNGSIHDPNYRTCQNLVSACLMAHINTSGVHIPLWLDSESPLVGWGISSNYPKQEGTFFGNIIETGDLTPIGMSGVTGPVAYFCEGAGITAGVVSGRLGSGQSGAPYKNPYGTNVQCNNSGYTTAGPVSAGQTVPDGYKQARLTSGYAFQNGEPVTVWRNPNYVPVFDQVYDYGLQPMSTSGKTVGFSGTSAVQWTTDNADDQKLKILAGTTSGTWKLVVGTDQSKCIGPVGGSIAALTTLEKQSCNDGPTQAWTISADANTGGFTLKSVSNSALCLEVANSAGNDGAPMQVNTCGTGSNQKFKMASSYFSTDTDTTTALPAAGGSSGSSGSGGSSGSSGSLFDPNTTYRLQPQNSTTESVDVSGGATTNGTVVWQYATWNGDPQKYFIRANGSNWMISMKANSAKCFGLVSNQTVNGTHIEIQDCNSSNSLQTWAAVPVSGQTNQYQLKNVGASNRCMTVEGVSSADFAKMNIYDCYNQMNEKFLITAAP